VFYLGIDIGKRHHQAALLDAAGTVLWRQGIAVSQHGFAALGQRLANVDVAQLTVGMEATGTYWLTLHAWLTERGVAQVVVLNPLQTRAFRNATIRGSKSDRIDAVAIATLVRWMGTAATGHVLPEERQAAAREVSRLRTEMVELRARQLVKLGSVLDRLFPEFADAFGKLGSASALAVLARWATPAALGTTDRGEVTAVLTRASHGLLGAAKAAELQALATASAGVPDPLDATAVAVRALVAHVEHLDGQIAALGDRLAELLAPDASVEALLRSCPGVGKETARTWLAEAPDVERFRGKDGADKLLAMVGLDVRISESGASAGRPRMSKRGNRYLRRALMLAAENAARTDPQCRAVLTKQRARGKPYRVAVSHVARKLVHILYAVLTRQRPYVLPAAYALRPEPPTTSIAELDVA
jgi:transposase